MDEVQTIQHGGKIARYNRSDLEISKIVSKCGSTCKE